MRTGDQDAVYRMYHILLTCATEALVPSLLRDQLGAEYGMKIEEGDESKDKLTTQPSEEEIALACDKLNISMADIVAELKFIDSL